MFLCPLSSRCRRERPARHMRGRTRSRHATRFRIFHNASESPFLRIAPRPCRQVPCPSTGIRSDAKNTMRDSRRRSRRCGEVPPWGSEPRPRAFDKRQRPQENEREGSATAGATGKNDQGKEPGPKGHGKAPRLHRSRTESLEGQFQPAENLLPTALATAMPLPGRDRPPTLGTRSGNFRWGIARNIASDLVIRNF